MYQGKGSLEPPKRIQRKEKILRLFKTKNPSK